MEKALWGDDRVFCFGNVNVKMWTGHPNRNNKQEAEVHLEFNWQVKGGVMNWELCKCIEAYIYSHEMEEISSWDECGQEASKGDREEQPVVGTRTRGQSVLEAGTQGGGSELAKLNSANTSGGFKDIGDVDESSLSAGGCIIMIGMGSKEDGRRRIGGRS